MLYMTIAHIYIFCAFIQTLSYRNGGIIYDKNAFLCQNYVKVFLIDGLFVLTQMVEDVFGGPRNTLTLALFLINSS